MVKDIPLEAFSMLMVRSERRIRDQMSARQLLHRQRKRPAADSKPSVERCIGSPVDVESAVEVYVCHLDHNVYGDRQLTVGISSHAILN